MDLKLQRELWVFELFRDAFPEGPLNDVVHSDTPDFRFSWNNKRVGLEITELFHDSFEGLPNSMQKSSFGSEFVADLIGRLSAIVAFKFGIGVVFTENVKISSSRRTELIAECAQIIAPYVVNLVDKQHVRLEQYNHNLPLEIHHIYFVRYDGMPESFDFRSEGGTIPLLEKDHLDQIIQGKESKMKDWFGFQEHWLLIREGNYFAGSFTLPETLEKYVSSFDRIYLIRTRGSVELIRLC